MALENDETLVLVLHDVLEQSDCTAGTIHRAEEAGLKLLAHDGIPESVLDNIGRVPIGKGIAGIAAERREPVQVCNLQTDDSGVAEPGARETMMEGTIPAPIIGSNDALEGTIEIAKPEPYEFSAAERYKLLDVGNDIAKRL